MDLTDFMTYIIRNRENGIGLKISEKTIKIKIRDFF